jgi:CubicO group peptidase (beta-lactamase class C family)
MLGLRGVGFNPGRGVVSVPAAYAAGRGLVRGVGFDSLLPVFKGEGPHSGLFGTGSDILRFMQIMLFKGKLPN